MTDSEIMRAALTATDAGRDHAIITIVSTSGSTPRRSGKLLVFASAEGETLGSVGGGEIERTAIIHALECIRRGRGDCVEYDLGGEVKMACGGRITLLTEVYRARPRLIICGAGHVGLALSPIARSAGFDITFVDDRDPSSLTGALCPGDEYIRTDSFERTLLDMPDNAYYVIVTHGHECDAECLNAIINKSAAYIGMIGSKNKIKAVYGELLGRGVSPDRLRGVYAPIGLDTGGETPGEIAVSIASELLAVRYSRRGGHLRDGAGLI